MLCSVFLQSELRKQQFETPVFVEGVFGCGCVKFLAPTSLIDAFTKSSSHAEGSYGPQKGWRVPGPVKDPWSLGPEGLLHQARAESGASLHLDGTGVNPPRRELHSSSSSCAFGGPGQRAPPDLCQTDRPAQRGAGWVSQAKKAFHQGGGGPACGRQETQQLRGVEGGCRGPARRAGDGLRHQPAPKGRELMMMRP